MAESGAMLGRRRRDTGGAREMNRRILKRRGGCIAAVLLLAAGLAACSGEDSPSPSPSPLSSSPPTVAPDWANNFSETQVEAADEGIVVLHSYDAKIADFVEAGQVTPDVLAYLQDTHVDWRAVWDGFITAEAEGRTTTKEPGWDAETTPTKVTVTSDDIVVVTIMRCIDPSKIADYIGGVAQLQPLTGNYEQIVGLERDKSGEWKVSGISADPQATCDLPVG